jgi:hypothetical protein
MDSDDISVKERIQTQVDFMLANPSVDLSGSSVIMFSEQNHNLRKVVVHPTHNTLIKQDMLFYCCLAHPSLIIRQRAFPRIRYDEQQKTAQFPEDYALWLQLIDTDTTFANIGTVLVHLRKHASNLSAGDKMAIEVSLKLPFISAFIEDD